MRSEVLHSRDGVALALHHFGGEGTTALFVHGTSFHAHVLAPVAGALPSTRSFGLDLRGHGASSRPVDGGFAWTSLGDDLDAALDVLELLSPGPVLGVGHSAGATALLLAAGRRPQRFEALYCYEPIALNDAVRARVALPAELAGAARRRADFSSKAEALTYFAARPPLSSFDPEVLEQYVEHGFLDGDDGRVHLACAPAYEASIYVAGYEADLLEELTRADCPATIAYGATSTGIGPACAPLVAEALPHGQLVRLEGLSHLGPLEDPERVAKSIITAFDTPAA
jgi:pimeloyl-ACP methyl ester carboxylesterase